MSKVVDAAVNIAAIIPGPWQPFAQAYLAISSIYGASQAKKQAAQQRAAQQAAQLAAYNASLKDRIITNIAADSPAVYVYGECRVGSSVVAIFTSGDRDQYKHLICIHAAHECEAISAVFINGNALGTLNADGFSADEKYAGKVRVRIHLGGATDPADSVLMAECPDKWFNTSVLRDYCYTYVRLDLDEQEFQSGIPSVQVQIKGKKLFDPRSNQTAWSSNNALVVWDYLTSEMCGVDPADLPVDQFIAAANVCDENLAFGARYTFNGTITADQDQARVLEQMAQSMAGGIVSTTWDIYAGKYVAPIMALTQDDIVGSLSIVPGVSDADLYNGVRGQYIGSETMYVPTDFKPFSNPTLVAADGRELWTNIDFPFTDSVQRAHNLARIFVEDQRNGYTVTADFSLKAWGLKVGSRVTLTSAAFGWSAKVFRVIDKKYSPTAPVNLTLKEDAAAAWDEADAVTAEATPNTGLHDPFVVAPPTGLTVAVENITGADGVVIPRMVASWIAPNDVYVHAFDVAWRENGGPWDTGTATDVRWVIPASVTGRSYDVRVRSVGMLRKSAWVDVNGTACAAPAIAPAAPSATARGDLFAVHLDWVFGDTRRDIRGTEVWWSATNNRAAAVRITQEPYPAHQYNHVSLVPGQSCYYWLRVVDTFDNASGWYPSSATAGIYATPNTDPASLLAQLQGSLGLPQLAADLAAPIMQVPDVSAAVQSAAESALQLLLKADALKAQAVRDKWILDATSTIDPASGKVTLLATAQISTDIEAKLNSVQLQLGAMDGSIVSHAASLVDHGGRIHTAETNISQMQGEIDLKASQVYVDGTVQQALGVVDPAAIASASQSGAEAVLNALLDADAGRRQALGAQARIAAAELQLTSHADALVAEAVERLILAAKVGNNEAALVLEQLARANADGALSSSLQTLLARLDTGDFAAVKTESSATASKVNGIEARWGVQVETMQDGNHAVAGIQLLSGAGGTVFAVLADKLLVYRPDGSGAPKQMMVLGTINGVTSLGLDGSLVVDGSIVARSITVPDLAAVNANLGTVTAGRAQNAANTNYLNLDAVGSQPFLKAGNKVTITAAGDVTLDGVVISRNLVAASGSYNAGSFSVPTTAEYAELKHWDIDTSEPISAWAGANSTYLANAGMTAAVYSGLDPDTGLAYAPDVYWGIVCTVLPLTRWNGSQVIRLRLSLWGKHVASVSNCIINWKLYKVT